jgi:hypothetical protein
MQLKKAISLMLLPAVLGGCGFFSNENSEKSNFDLSKLTGRWEFMNNNTHQIEEWTSLSEHELRGKGFILENGDTTFIEILSIRENDGVLTYYAQVSDIESAEIVPFRLSEQTGQRIEFVNENQDFPKKIGYELRSEDRILSYIEGPREGNNVRISFDFKKTN